MTLKEQWEPQLPGFLTPNPAGVIMATNYGHLNPRFAGVYNQTQEERFHLGVFSEKLKLTKSSVPSLITFNCDIKFPKGFLSL